MRYNGSCHCGSVRFTVEAPEKIEAHDCNCSICSMSGYLALILPVSKFELLAGEDNLITYTFNTGVARHTFCKTCGVKPFYIPRSNPDGISINVRCLSPAPRKITVTPFDGRHWEEHAHSVAHLSKDE
jgi:hypothetical protein